MSGEAETKHPIVALRELMRSREGQSDMCAVPVELGLLRRLLARVDLPPERQPGRIGWDGALAVAQAFVEERREECSRSILISQTAIRQLLQPIEERLKQLIDDDHCARCGIGFLVVDRTGGVGGSVRVKVGDKVYHGACERVGPHTHRLPGSGPNP
ncbi:MAG: hypothetical protein Q8S13_09830 [Dehalococcoidia bacterium]|nr:hypothetical protein [Dehalococcoidia bacterium]